MIKAAIVGFGKMGQTRLKACESTGLFKITKVFEPNESIRTDGLIYAETLDELLSDKEIKALFICSPNSQNAEYCSRALKNDKHVFCEKPPAINSQELKEVKKIASNSTRVLMYGFNHRLHGSVQKIKEIVVSREFGEILWMRGRYGKSVDSSFFSNWRASKEKAGGGILLDQGIHMIDLALYLNGNSFDKIVSSVSNKYWKIEDIEDNVFAIMKSSKTGVEVSIHSTMTQWRHLFSLEVFFQKGYTVLNGLKTSSNTYGDEVLTIA